MFAKAFAATIAAITVAIVVAAIASAPAAVAAGSTGTMDVIALGMFAIFTAVKIVPTAVGAWKNPA